MRNALLLLLLLAQETPLRPEDPASAVHPRKFGSPGGVGVTRGWYVWRSFDPETWRARVSHEQTGETYDVRVLPWMTVWRHQADAVSPADLLPGERLNLFFNPEGPVKRAYLVHVQDEIGQMKGHDTAWRVESATESGFTARGMTGEKAIDEKPLDFVLDPKCRILRGDGSKPKAGERLLLTWCYEDSRRVVKLVCDVAGLPALQAETKKRVAERLAREGMAGFMEAPERLLVFSTYWPYAAALKPGQKLILKASDAAYRPVGDGVEVRVASRKNLGAYGSGATEVLLDGASEEQAKVLRGWGNWTVVRVFTP